MYYQEILSFFVFFTHVESIKEKHIALSYWDSSLE